MATDADFRDFDALFTELHYRQAQQTLRTIVTKLDLTPRERQGLEEEFAELEQMLQKLEQQMVQIAVFGMVGRGKSSLLNALIGAEVFVTGPTHGVTQTKQAALWHVRQERRTTRASWGGIELIDTPGIDEIDGAERAALALEVAAQADLILFVVAGDMTQVEYEALSQLRQASKPILLVFNKIDQYPPRDRTSIYRKICDERVRQLLTEAEIVMAAAAPLMPQVTTLPDGSTKVELVYGDPQVTDLKLKILDILDREGTSLIALNSMLFADHVHDRIVQRKVFLRDRRANQLIWNAVLTQAVAIAINPVTVIDLVSTAIIDVTMIVQLSKIYGLVMDSRGAIALLQKIALAMGGLTVSEFLTTLGLSSLKTLLGIATPLTGGGAMVGYVSVALTQASVAGFSTYALGLVAKEYFANGSTWGSQNPRVVVQRILATLDRDSILARIKEELQEKLERQRWQAS